MMAVRAQSVKNVFLRMPRRVRGEERFQDEPHATRSGAGPLTSNRLRTCERHA